MADTFTSNLGLRKTEVGKTSWGPGEQTDKDLFDEAVAGSVNLTVTTGATLTITDGTSDDGRHATIVLAGTPSGSQTITVPNVEKVWNFVNPLDEPMQIKTASGTAIVLPPAASAVVVCDGANNVRFAGLTLRATEGKKKDLASGDSPYSVSLLDREKLLAVNASGGAVTITLPTISNIAPVVADRSGFKISVYVEDDTNAVTINAGGSDTIGIGGGTSRVLRTQAQFIQLESDEDGHWIPTAGGEGVIGEIKIIAGAKAPSGYLACDFAAVSRTTYAALFDQIGTTYGVGNGTTTFNLPDLRGRSPMGTGQGDTAEGGGSGTSRSEGDKDGAEDHTLTEAELAAHTHGPGTLATGTGGGHSHTVAFSNSGAETPNNAPGVTIAQPGGSTGTSGSGSHSHSLSTGASGSTGSGNAHENTSPVLAVPFYIYAGA